MTTVVPGPQGYTQALDLIDAAYRQVRGVNDTAPITAFERENGLFSLRMMLDEWSANQLTVPAVVREQFTTACGQDVYRMGPDGDWDTARPTLILDMRVNFGGVDLPVALVGYDDYAAIRLKTLSVNPPQVAWPDYAHPLCNVTLYPVPGAALTITTVSEKPLQDVRGMFDKMEFPPGYEAAIVHNLALRLGAQDALTATVAANALRQLKARNQRKTTLGMDPMLRGNGRRFDIRSGSWY